MEKPPFSLRELREKWVIIDIKTFAAFLVFIAIFLIGGFSGVADYIRWVLLQRGYSHSQINDLLFISACIFVSIPIVIGIWYQGRETKRYYETHQDPS